MNMRRLPTPPALATVEGVATERWTVMVPELRGVVHAAAIDATLGTITWCGRVGDRRRLVHGQPVDRCVLCTEAIFGRIEAGDE